MLRMLSWIVVALVVVSPLPVGAQQDNEQDEDAGVAEDVAPEIKQVESALQSEASAWKVAPGQATVPQAGFTLTPECTTEATDGDGVRHSCSSSWSTFTTPADHVVVEKGVRCVKTNANGSENSCDIRFANWVEIIPGTGIVQPMTVSVRAEARGPRGHWAGRGWTNCSCSGQVVKFR